MASAKKEAESMLGPIDKYINTKGLNKERKIANQVYKTNSTAFKNAYNDLLSTIATNRDKARTDFSSGRAAVNENAFMKNRESTSDLASRGLNGGLVQLNKLGNRMETGRQYSNLANTFYNTMSDIDATERTGTNEYNTNIETARNTLNAALADIGSREAAARNAYKAQVAQLAEQIQARRDAAAQAAAYRAALAKQNKVNGNDLIKQDILKKGLSWAEASDYLVNNGFAKNTKAAINWLKKNTALRPTEGGYSSPSGYKVRNSLTSTPTTTTSSGFKWTDLLNILGPIGR